MQLKEFSLISPVIKSGTVLKALETAIAFPKQLRYTQIFVTKVSSFENVPHQIGNRYIPTGAVSQAIAENIVRRVVPKFQRLQTEEFPFFHLACKRNFG
jgi:hypothetical protein